MTPSLLLRKPPASRCEVAAEPVWDRNHCNPTWREEVGEQKVEEVEEEGKEVKEVKEVGHKPSRLWKTNYYLQSLCVTRCF